MQCFNCECSLQEKPLVRVNKVGVNAIWCCESCLKELSPDAYKNYKENKSDFMKDLEKIIYN